MHPHAPPLIAMRFLDLGDGTSLDLATAGRVWIERRALDEVSRLVWPGVIETLARLWHPAVATCVDFGWANAHEWFEAYAVPEREGLIAGRAMRALSASASSFVRAHDVPCAWRQGASSGVESRACPNCRRRKCVVSSRMNRRRGSACVWPIVHSVGACLPRSTIRAGRGLASGASTPSPAAGGAASGACWRAPRASAATSPLTRGYWSRS